MYANLLRIGLLLGNFGYLKFLIIEKANPIKILDDETKLALKLLIVFLLNIVPCYHAIRLGLNEPRLFAFSFLLAVCAFIIRDINLNKIHLTFVGLIFLMTLLTLISVLNFLSNNSD